MNQTEQIAATHLGKKSTGSDLYDRSLLVAVPRVENRKAYNINESSLPFYGYDVWNAYEVSFMTCKNVPITKVMKLKYPCTSPYIVESKSLKLYLNSFNMTPLKNTVEESIEFFKNTVESDLSTLLHTNVELTLHDKITGSSSLFNDYVDISDVVDLNNIECVSFKEEPILLEAVGGYQEFNIKIDCLRSNCRVTHQPDFGDLFIHYKGNKTLRFESLFKYIVSFRKEYHFHEECVEMIYKRLYDKLKPQELLVTALYTRRGGIDICPSRYNKEHLAPTDLLDLNKYQKYTAKQ